MERKMRVTGKGYLSIKPDQVLLKLSLSKVKDTYENAIKASAEDMNEIKDVLANLGFEREELKTSYFNVDTEYESYKDNNGNYKSRFVGYKYKQDLNYKFDLDNKVLGKVLFALSKTKCKAKINIVYTVKDAEKAKNELLKNAVEDSKNKAKILVEASGLTLGNIINIDYSFRTIEFISDPYRDRDFNLYECCCSTDGSLDIDVNPEDINVNDNVTIEWEIK